MVSQTASSTGLTKPLWLRLVMLVGVECVWSAVIGVLLTLSGWQVWFEVYFLLCYLPCLVYYTHQSR